VHWLFSYIDRFTTVTRPVLQPFPEGWIACLALTAETKRTEPTTPSKAQNGHFHFFPWLPLMKSRKLTLAFSTQVLTANVRPAGIDQVPS
ncbi:hypothetical protein L249_8649, partial [Ophiocordyceps polyrhachis-furcata BCC 54312]